jgi:hypothetical protein
VLLAALRTPISVTTSRTLATRTVMFTDLYWPRNRSTGGAADTQPPRRRFATPGHECPAVDVNCARPTSRPTLPDWSRTPSSPPPARSRRPAWTARTASATVDGPNCLQRTKDKITIDGLRHMHRETDRKMTPAPQPSPGVYQPNGPTPAPSSSRFQATKCPRTATQHDFVRRPAIQRTPSDALRNAGLSREN